MEKVLKKVEKIESYFNFADCLIKVFVCGLQGNSKEPLVSSCCQHVVGCKGCINQWLTSHTRCPHCSENATTIARFTQLRGFDDTIEVAVLITGTKEDDAADKTIA